MQFSNIARCLPLICLLSFSCLAQEPEAKCAGDWTPVQLQRHIDAMLNQLTPEEKIAQLQYEAPAIPRLGIPAYVWWNEGLHGIARNGRATVFPQAIGLAATWDSVLIHRIGEAISSEARGKFNPHASTDSPWYGGLTIWSPNINIFRDPRWGRGQETYGEDPYLTGTLGTEFVRGIQAANGFYLAANATPKHFAVHSGPESLRDAFNAVASAHDLADTYLAAFHHVVAEASPSALMCSYNAINGIPACANEPLLSGKLRQDWGFTGYIVSDCDAVGNISQYHHFSPDNEHASATALRAGVDLDCGRTYSALNKALADKLITEHDLDAALGRLLLARYRLGMLQPELCSRFTSIEPSVVDSPAHRALALKAAEESMVLLKNDGILPLRNTKRIAVIGATGEMLGTIEANYHGTASSPRSLLAGLREGIPSADIRYAQGSTLAPTVTVPVPSTALRTLKSGKTHAGLDAEFFNSVDFSGKPVTRVDATIDTDWDRAPPADGITAAHYSARWTGQLVPPAPGHYRLHISTDRCYLCSGHDEARLLIDGRVRFDSASKDLNRDVELDSTARQTYKIQLDVAHTGEDEGVRLEWEAPTQAQIDEALQVARQSDVILVFVGLSPSLEGEAMPVRVPGFDGGDRTQIELPDPQRKLLTALFSLKKPTVIVTTSGSALALGEARNQAGAILAAWYPGEEGGQALANLLTGAANPSGRLPVTWYHSTSDLPSFTDYSMANRTYRYFKGQPDYPFGFGLSYSKFFYEAPLVSTRNIRANDPFQVRTSVTNTSESEADEVVQMYISAPVKGAPRLALTRFERIHFKPHQRREVAFTIDSKALGVVNALGEKETQPGNYKIFVGGAQPDDLGRTPSAVVTVLP